MGRLLDRAIEQAGLTALAARALSGAGLPAEDLRTLRASDLLLVAGLADAVRQRHRGDEVRLMSEEAARRDPEVLQPALRGGGASGPTGQELLLEIALARLAAPAARSIAVSFEQLGLELAQTALAFGADVLIGDLSTRRTLPLLDGPAARRQEITGLCERAGRRVRWVSAPQPAVAQQSPAQHSPADGRVEP